MPGERGERGGREGGRKEGRKEGREGGREGDWSSGRVSPAPENGACPTALTIGQGALHRDSYRSCSPISPSSSPSSSALSTYFSGSFLITPSKYSIFLRARSCMGSEGRGRGGEREREREGPGEREGEKEGREGREGEGGRGREREEGEGSKSKGEKGIESASTT